MSLASLLFHDVFDRQPGDSGFIGPVADRYKVTRDTFDAYVRAIAGVQEASPRLVRTPADAYGDGFALTFDDGGASYATAIADRLEARGWRGHCFMSTGEIGKAGFLTGAQLRDLDARGHLIGSHSATHPVRFSACSWRQMVDEWQTSRAVLEDLLGHAVTVASLPGGYFSRQVALSAGAAGLRVLFTSEPDLDARPIGTCAVVGRLAVRHGMSAARVAALSTGRSSAVWRERNLWRLKKTIKPILGSAYPRIGAWLTARHPTVSSR